MTFPLTKLRYYSNVDGDAKWQSYLARVLSAGLCDWTVPLSAALDNRQVIQKAMIVLVGFLASGVLGFLREAVLARQFGAAAARDSFVAAQQIPEIVFVLVAGGALGSSFIPIYAKYRESDSEQAWQLASAVMTLAAAAAAALGLLVAIFAPQLVSSILSPGRPAEQQQLTVYMIRLMMLTPFIFSISGMVMGILQSHAAFWLPAIAISMNHIGIIIGALWIAPSLPAHPGVGQVGDLNVVGLAYGAILSALLHLLVQLPGLYRLRARLRPLLSLQIPGVLTVLRLMGPRVLGLAVVQVNMVVNISLASNMVEGSVAALKIAFTMMFFALGIIGQSVGSAVFPTLAALCAAGDIDGFKDRLSMAMRNVLFLSFPATALLILLGEPIFSVYESGEWTRESSGAAAWALAFYATGIAGFTLLEVLSRAFYALEDTATPVIIGSIAMISNLILNLILIQYIGDPQSLARGAFAGLALANALTTLVESLLLWYLMRRRIARRGTVVGMHDRAILRSAGGSLLATLAMALGLWLLTSFTPLADWQLALIGAVIGAVIFFGISYLFNLSETRAVLSPFLRRLN